jgi:hypothetical protein
VVEADRVREARVTRTPFGARELQLGTLDDFAHLQAPAMPFALMLATGPASPSPGELALIEVLACSNCREMCFVGPAAEFLHDRADEVVETRGLLDVVTTSFSSETVDEVAFYFVSVAGAKPPVLLAPVGHLFALASAVQKAAGTDQGLAEA